MVFFVFLSMYIFQGPGKFLSDVDFLGLNQGGGLMLDLEFFKKKIFFRKKFLLQNYFLSDVDYISTVFLFSFVLGAWES